MKRLRRAREKTGKNHSGGAKGIERRKYELWELCFEVRDLRR